MDHDGQRFVVIRDTTVACTGVSPYKAFLLG